MINELNYEKKKKSYGLLSSLPIVIAIIHAIGQILIQTYGKISETGDKFISIPGFGLSYSSSIFACLLTSKRLDPTILNSTSSICSLILTLAIIFLSSFSVKGKKIPTYINLAIYSFDTIMLIPTLIINYHNILPLNMSLVDVILSIIIHVIGICINIYLTLLLINLNKFEKREDTI